MCARRLSCLCCVCVAQLSKIRTCVLSGPAPSRSSLLSSDAWFAIGNSFNAKFRIFLDFSSSLLRLCNCMSNNPSSCIEYPFAHGIETHGAEVHGIQLNVVSKQRMLRQSDLNVWNTLNAKCSQSARAKCRELCPGMFCFFATVSCASASCNRLVF